MAEPTRMLVFDGVLSEAQATTIRMIYYYLAELPDEVRQAIAKDLADTYGTTREPS